ALSPVGERMEALPIAPPTDIIRSEAEQAVARLIEITRTRQETKQLLLDWLRTEFEVQEPGNRLETFAELDMQMFVEEVRKRRPKWAGKLTPATLRALQAGYTEQAVPMQQSRIEATALERKLNDLVNAAYDLTSEEIALMWQTAPPRMPLKLL